MIWWLVGGVVIGLIIGVIGIYVLLVKAFTNIF